MPSRITTSARPCDSPAVRNRTMRTDCIRRNCSIAGPPPREKPRDPRGRSSCTTARRTVAMLLADRFLHRDGVVRHRDGGARVRVACAPRGRAARRSSGLNAAQCSRSCAIRWASADRLRRRERDDHLRSVRAAGRSSARAARSHTWSGTGRDSCGPRRPLVAAEAANAARPSSPLRPVRARPSARCCSRGVRCDRGTVECAAVPGTTPIRIRRRRAWACAPCK